MKCFKICVFLLAFMTAVSVPVFAEAQKNYKGSRRSTVYDKIKLKDVSEAQAVQPVHIAEPIPVKAAVPVSFQVNEVKFETVIIDTRVHLVAAVLFNKEIDSSTVQENLNIRLLKEDEQGYWRDASTQNNTVNVRPTFITWVSGTPLQGGSYKMHLRGTIKSSGGLYLDCDGDGTGEMGNLPAYESQLYQSGMIELDPMDGDQTGRIEDLFGGMMMN